MSSNLQNKTVAVIGCGGLGGFVIDEIVRLGIGKIVIVDGDTFSQSNLNRQLAANKETIGHAKSLIYQDYIKKLSDCEVEVHNEFFTKKNANILNQVDLVFDCVDSIKDRFLLANECDLRNIVMIHGAIDNEQGQVMICSPASIAMEELFPDKNEIKHATTSYAVATVASLQVNLGYKVLTGQGKDLFNKLFVVDMATLRINRLDL